MRVASPARSLTPREGAAASPLQPRRARLRAPLRAPAHPPAPAERVCAAVRRSASQLTAEAAAAARAATRLQRHLNEQVAAKAQVEARLRQVEARVEEAVRAATASAVQLTAVTETWFAISNVRLEQSRAAPPRPRPAPRRTPCPQPPALAHARAHARAHVHMCTHILHIAGAARRARCGEGGGVGTVPRWRGLVRCRALRLSPLHLLLLRRRPLARASPRRPRRAASAARLRRAAPPPAHQPQLASEPAAQPAPAGPATAQIRGALRDGRRRRGLSSGEPRAADGAGGADRPNGADRADGRLRKRSLRSCCPLAATFCPAAPRAAPRATADFACHRRTGRGATAFRGLAARVTCAGFSGA